MAEPTILGSAWRELSQAQAELRAWEQKCLDEFVADVFGFHALQLGSPEVEALRLNRIAHRWVGLQHLPGSARPADTSSDAAPLPLPTAPALSRLVCDFDALPLPSQSVDLVVLVHALEASLDPHLTLREAERVLVPEGRLVVIGFNPKSLWGLRQRWHADRSDSRDWIAYGRLRDWMRLLGFEVHASRFGGFRPPLAGNRWLQRTAWLEIVGQRWWPMFGAVYGLMAVKRVRGMRLVGLARRQARYASAPRPVAVNRHNRDLPPATP